MIGSYARFARIRFAYSNLLRCLLACLILSTFVIGAWSLMVPRAYAASLTAAASAHAKTVQNQDLFRGIDRNPFQIRRIVSQPKPIQDGHSERERRISRPAEILRSRSE